MRLCQKGNASAKNDLTCVRPRMLVAIFVEVDPVGWVASAERDFGGKQTFALCECVR